MLCWESTKTIENNKQHYHIYIYIFFLSIHMYIHAYIYMYICIYMHITIYMYIYAYIYIQLIMYIICYVIVLSGRTISPRKRRKKTLKIVDPWVRLPDGLKPSTVQRTLHTSGWSRVFGKFRRFEVKDENMATNLGPRDWKVDTFIGFTCKIPRSNQRGVQGMFG